MELRSQKDPIQKPPLKSSNFSRCEAQEKRKKKEAKKEEENAESKKKLQDTNLNKLYMDESSSYRHSKKDGIYHRAINSRVVRLGGKKEKTALLAKDKGLEYSTIFGRILKIFSSI